MRYYEARGLIELDEVIAVVDPRQTHVPRVRVRAPHRRFVSIGRRRRVRRNHVEHRDGRGDARELRPEVGDDDFVERIGGGAAIAVGDRACTGLAAPGLSVSFSLAHLAGSWPLANLQMAQALKTSLYDFHFRFGTAAHNSAQWALDLPESLVWLWRDYDPNKTSQEFEQEEAERVKPLYRIGVVNRDAW